MTTETTETTSARLALLATEAANLASKAYREEEPHKRFAFLQTLEITDTLNEMIAVTNEINGQVGHRLFAVDKVGRLKTQMSEHRALVYLNGIEGKNQEARDAQLTVTLKDDAEYQRLQNEVREAEFRVNEINSDLEFLGNKLSALKIKARLATATLEFLAGA